MRTLVLLSGLAIACDAGEKPSPPVPPEQPAPKLVERSASGAVFEYLPAASDLVVVVDVAALRRTKLWPAYARDVARILVPAFAGCAYDPLADASSVVISVPFKQQLGVVVVRGLDRDKAAECLRAAAVVNAFADAHTLVMLPADMATGAVVPTQQAVTALLQRRARPSSDAFVAAFDAAQRKLQAGPISIVSRPGSETLRDNMKDVGIHLEQLYGTARVGDRLDVRFGFVLHTTDEATQLASMMKGQLSSPQLEQMADRLDVSSDAATVTLDIGMTATQLDSLAKMLRGMLPQTDSSHTRP